MSDGARKEVADSTDSAAYFGPMSEAKQNHEAMQSSERIPTAKRRLFGTPETTSSRRCVAFRVQRFY